MRLGFGVALLLAAGILLAEDRTARKKKKALKDDDVAATWVYDDLKAALEVAREQKKPIFLVFR